MEAIISGELGTATLIDGGVAEVLWMDGRKRKISSSEAYSINRNALDIVYLNSCTKSQALALLKSHWMKDRALIFILTLLDANTPPKDRIEIQKTLDEWMSDDGVATYLKHVMYSRPLPSSDIAPIDEINIKSSIGKMLKALLEDQSQIQHIRESWEEIAKKLSVENQKEYEKRLIAMGAYFRLVSPSRKDLIRLKFECFENCSDLENYRETINAIIDPFIESESLVSGNIDSQVVAIYEPERDEVAISKPIKVTQKHLDHVQECIEKAKGMFREGKINQAQQTISWLVNEQLSRGDSEYAARTLCSASEMAKHKDLFNLQLDYAHQAHEISPNDARVLGHIGDACINLEQYENASKWFSKASEEGDKGYGLTGLVRVLRKQNHLNEAYKLILEVLEIEGDELEPLMHKAEILRGLEKYEEAIETYQRLHDKYPYNEIILCGLAATYADAEMYKLSLNFYDQSISIFQDHSVAYTAKGHLLARLGKLREALFYLYRGINLAKDKTIAVNALASALRINGKVGKSIKILEKQSYETPNSEETWIGLIRGAIQCGKYTDARKWLDDAVKHIGSTSALSFQKANYLAEIGDNKDALKVLNILIDEHPHYIEASIEKTRLLRRLNRTKDAEYEIGILLNNFPRNQNIEKEAIILGLANIPDEMGCNRLSNRDYATYEDWDYSHACSVGLLKKEDAKNAWFISLDGKKRSPFRYLRRRFGFVLAIVRDFLGRTGSVISALKGYKGPEAILIRAIVYWKLGVHRQLDRVLTEIHRIKGNDSQNNSNVAELFDLLSLPYNPILHDQRVSDFENRLMIQVV